MKLRKRWLFGLALLALAGVLTYFILSLNRYQTDGTLTLPGLKDKVTVYRDEKGMPYIYAANADDALTALGFITAQDRLFTMELTRRYAEGRLSELAGPKTESVDISMRTIGLFRNAKKLAAMLDPESRNGFQRYVNGINAYIQGFRNEHPIEFTLSGLKPEPWAVEDSLAVLFFMSWTTSGNLDTEIIMQALIDKIGPKGAQKILPLNINPDDAPRREKAVKRIKGQIDLPGVASDRLLLSLLEDRSLRFGSNNWAAGPERSANGKPIVANDPHLDARVLPGPWYPFGLITPAYRWVGVAIPGIPGSNVGRNDHVAIGVTNSYGDTQDLYIETLDPKSSDRYLEGRQAFPFETISETIKIRDQGAPNGMREKAIRIRLTHRGPVVSGVLSGISGKKVVSLRWAPFEAIKAPLTIDTLMSVKSVQDVRKVLSHLDFMAFNFVFADQEGNIGWQTSGKLPIRSQRDATLPFAVKDSKDNWVGWIPFERMPHQYNPERGWVGTCNHYTVFSDYPFYYSSYAAPSYRYRRLLELMKTPQQKTADDHWRFQRDSVNVMARAIAPVMAKALQLYEDTKQMGDILSAWNYEDSADQAAPLIFQAVYREFALMLFQIELGEATAGLMLKSWYFWQERLQDDILKGDLPFFVSHSEDDREQINEFFHLAAHKALTALSPKLGEDVSQWKWGKVHKMELVSPIRREGFGKGWLGAIYPMSGSGETLYRAAYDFRNPFRISYTASLRMVADLGDPDKVLAVLPGGVSGRVFHPHNRDQLDAFMNGEKRYWWFSDKAIKEHVKSTLILKP